MQDPIFQSVRRAAAIHLSQHRHVRSKTLNQRRLCLSGRRGRRRGGTRRAPEEFARTGAACTGSHARHHLACCCFQQRRPAERAVVAVENNTASVLSAPPLAPREDRFALVDRLQAQRHGDYLTIRIGRVGRRWRRHQR